MSYNNDDDDNNHDGDVEEEDVDHDGDNTPSSNDSKGGSSDDEPHNGATKGHRGMRFFTKDHFMLLVLSSMYSLYCMFHICTFIVYLYIYGL